MLWHQPSGVQSLGFLQALGNHFRGCIEDWRWKHRAAKEVTREQVSAEEHIMAGTIETAVTEGVTGQMYHLEPAPERQRVTICESDINLRGSADAQQPAARAFHSTTPDGSSGIGECSVDVDLLERVGIYGCARPRFRPCEIARVIQVSVRQQNRFHIPRPETQPAEAHLDLGLFADQTGVDQHDVPELIHE